MSWQTAKRTFSLERPLIMAILNVTPDSFSDGGRFATVDAALQQAEKLVAEGADIIDIGGESTRPGGLQISSNDEIARVIPVIKAIAKRFPIAISIDTSKAEVAQAAVDNGAEIINDISGLRFDPNIGKVASESKCGLILMHSRGTFAAMHSLPPVADIFQDVVAGFKTAIDSAEKGGVSTANIALDIGIGFGKTLKQNLQLLANLSTIVAEFATYPMLVGASRKSFIGKLGGGETADERLSGSLAAAAIAVFNGAKILRVHDVKETVAAIAVVSAIEKTRR